MKKLMVCMAMLVAMLGTGAYAQDLSGNWQGTLHLGKDLRIIFNLYKGDKDGWSAKMYSIDQTPQPIPVNSVARDGANIRIAVDLLGGKFEGKLSDDSKTMTGTWTQGGAAVSADAGEGDAGDCVGDPRGAEAGCTDGRRCGSVV